MKRLTYLIAVLLMPLGGLTAQTAATDSVDVLDYDIALDLSQGTPFHGEATLTAQLLRGCGSISLDLIGSADSLWVNGTRIGTPDLRAIPTAGIAAGDTFTVRVCYHGSGYVEERGFGGFHLDNNLHYNLGVGFNATPHVLGRAIMPCRDNFTDKATYTLRIRAKAGWTAECSGLLQSRDTAADNTEHSVWRIGLPVCTYLVGISQAAWHRIADTVAGYPVTYGYTSQNSNTVRRVFEQLDSVVPMYERCFGPYRWGRIGYIATTYGSMEHVNNIALAHQAMESMSEMGQSTIAHELGHAWFGNLVTCADEGDMWINEGGASFCSEVAMEAVSGRAASDAYYQTNLEAVIRATHVTDNGYRSLSGMAHDYTYGSTTYDKGWMVWHSLRGYLGEELFYASLRRLMDSKAFGNIDAYQLRDSLSLYSGVDLTDFFDFHVFSPGFVDYRVDMDNNDDTPHRPRITLRQQSVATDAIVRSNRVPVTIFSRSGQQHKQWIAFSGSDTALNMDLPFDDPAFCVLDRDMELSDAATLAVIDATRAGQTTHRDCHLRITLAAAMPEGTSVAVEHHWGHPWDIDTVTGVLHTANRYWIIRGPQQLPEGSTGHLHYVRDGYENSSFPYLDRGFYSRVATLDSVAVLYRQGPGHPWVALSRVHSPNTNDGYFTVGGLRLGEYTLAVVDTNLLHIAAIEPADAGALLFPNPVQAGTQPVVEAPFDEPFTLSVFSADGRKLWSQSGCQSGVRIEKTLPAGTYLVQIENKCVSLQSKLIVL